MDPSISSVYVLLVQVTMTRTYQNDPKPHQPDERNHRGHHHKVHGLTIPLNHCPHQLKHPAANMTGQETG